MNEFKNYDLACLRGKRLTPFLEMILYFFKFVLMAKHTMISSVTRVIVQTHDSLVSLTDSLVLSSVYILRSSESNHLATSEKLLLFNELSFSRQRDGTGN